MYVKAEMTFCFVRVPFSFVELSFMHEAWNIFGILSSHKQVWCEVLKIEVYKKLNSIYADYVYILHYSWRLKGILTIACWIRYWRTDSKAVWLWNILRLKLTKEENYLQIHTVSRRPKSWLPCIFPVLIIPQSCIFFLRILNSLDCTIMNFLRFIMQIINAYIASIAISRKPDFRHFIWLSFK